MTKIRTPKTWTKQTTLIVICSSCKISIDMHKVEITVYFINTREAAHCCEEQFTIILLLYHLILSSKHITTKIHRSS